MSDAPYSIIVMEGERIEYKVDLRASGKVDALHKATNLAAMPWPEDPIEPRPSWLRRLFGGTSK